MKSDIEKPLPKVWRIVDSGSMECDPESKEKMQQMYSDVTELYHEFRPGYPEHLVDEAIQKSKLLQKDSQSKLKILEIGCGPGTLTIALAKRGYNIMAIDPGVGMIEKAREVCKDFTNIQFEQTTLKDFSSEDKYDAIVAATSLHWALADSDKDKLIQKMANLLKDDGSLILFWNLPPEPNNQVLDKIADALEKPKPFHFANASNIEHWEQMQERVLRPIENSPFFTQFETVECSIMEDILIERYMNFLKTMSNIITMEDEEQNVFFVTVRKILRESCGDSVATTRNSMFNISFKTKAT